MNVNVPHYEVNVPHYEMKPVKIYHLKRNQYVSLFVLAAIVLAIAAELLAFLSDRASSYTIENIDTIMTFSEIAIFQLIAVFILSIYLKGKVSLVILDLLRFGSVVLLCYSLYYVLSDRALLMGYVWFSDLASGNADAVTALNYGVISAALYVVTVILLAVSGGWDLVSANKVERTPEVIKAEIAALQKELDEYYATYGGAETETKTETKPVETAGEKDTQKKTCKIGDKIIKADEFICSLDEKEREEFYYLFVDGKYGNFKGVPAYVAGGDNGKFFEAVISDEARFKPMLSYELMEKIKEAYVFNGN